jgi:hypothetical protein
VEFVIGADQRTVLVGRTGSGKSTLLNVLVGSYRNLVVIDPKHQVTMPASWPIYDPRTFAQWWPQRSTRVVYRPDPEANDPKDVDEVVRRVLRFGNTALVWDEAMLYATPGWILPAYKRAIITGRSLGVPVFSATQRPTGVHNVVLSEAEHVFVFDLALEADRRKLAGIVGDDVMVRPDRKYAFGYAGPTTAGGLVRCDPLEVSSSGPSERPEPRDRHAAGDGRHLPDQDPVADVQRSRPVGPGQRDLTPRRR